MSATLPSLPEGICVGVPVSACQTLFHSGPRQFIQGLDTLSATASLIVEHVTQLHPAMPAT